MPSEHQTEVYNQLQKTTTESEVQADLRALLLAMDADNVMDVNTGDGQADIILHQYRIVIETKRPGLADQPHQPQHRNNSETPFQQLERYIESLRSQFLNRFDLEEVGDRSWLGILTDGRIWHVWRWPHRAGAAAEIVCLDFLPSSANDLIPWLSGLISEGGRVGRPWPPVQLAQEFLPDLDNWHDLYANLDGRAADHTKTKWELWRDMMVVSGMLPTNEQARNRLFVSHSYLVLIARGVVWTLTHREADYPEPEQIYGDGFAAWVLEEQTGRQMAGNLLERIHGWDWRARPGDILREVYATLIDPGDRQDFGEFYTPDWLAELVVRTVLDSEWCAQSIRHARNPKGLPAGIGVLDPACGSGTFLYHAVRYLLSHPDLQNMTLVRQADVVASLVNGLDVHPVAVEIARATLLRALPAEPSSGVAGIRIYLGDSLNTPRQAEGLFGGTRNGALMVTTPRGTEMQIPRNWVNSTGFDEQLRLLVLAAKEGNPLPPEVAGTTDEEQELLQKLHRVLARIIQREGNSIWSWFISHRSATDRLRNRKINRIIANPPWVKLSNIQVVSRKRALEHMAITENLWEGGKNAPHFDIAQLFVQRCRHQFMQNPEGDAAGWLVKRSALSASNWKKFRERRSCSLEGRIQTVDLDLLKPFGGGDARRCCLILENNRLEPADANRLQAIPLPSGRRLVNDERLNQVSNLLQFEPMPQQILRAQSGYLDDGKPVFRQGATIVPHVLAMIAGREEGQTHEFRRITTKQSQHAPWNTINPQYGEVPASWLKPVLRSSQLLPFATMPEDLFIIPVDEGDNLLENPGLHCDFWQELERIYRERRGHGGNTPATLLKQFDYNGKLKRQLPMEPGNESRMVLYPTSGDIMRAARSFPRIIDSSVYYHFFDNEEEAAYLVGLLNAPALRLAFNECRSSGRHFHLFPLRNVPIPEFNRNNKIHRELARQTVEAETATLDLVQELQDNLKERQSLPGQIGLSKRIRERLVENGIAGLLDEAAAQLLPNQVR
ncbi:MAG: N-6 DNA methylase [Paracoccaceae bacterium]|nr:N-6 DNA methylase [Paracoccaceae bacterium]MDE2917804.1 N-6 DNA methylase [Paracoccaceae bacterium]